MPGHIQISIEATEPQQEILIAGLTDVGAAGFEQMPDRLIVYFDQDAFPAYEVNNLLHGYDFTTNDIAAQNWNALWESNFEPVAVADFCAVRAHFHQPINGVEHQIIITPKMSFGTGHHATTYMMMQAMRKMDFEGKKVFDFGTGTGILAILAEKLGAASIVAVDNDDWSIENGKENLLRNGCSKIDIHLASSVPEDEFDIILANINRNVILTHLPQLVATVKAGGSILFSGLLATDEATIAAACSSLSLQLKEKEERTNWIALRFQKG